MKKNYKIKILDAKKDSDLLFKIVEHENKVFGEATVGNWNIKPFAKYGKVFAMLSDDKDSLQFVMETLKEMGIKKIELTVDMDNFTAKRIYEKLGFEIVDNLDNEYGDNVERYLMRYSIK